MSAATSPSAPAPATNASTVAIAWAARSHESQVESHKLDTKYICPYFFIEVGVFLMNTLWITNKAFRFRIIKLEPMIIGSSSKLVKYLEETDSTKVKRNKPKIGLSSYEVRRKTFEGVTFTKDFQSIDFKNCRFLNCTFEDTFGFYLNFIKCKFEECMLKNSRFSHFDLYWEELLFSKCLFRNVQWDEGGLHNVSFDHCDFYAFNMQEMDPKSFVHFTNCYIENSQFQSNLDEDAELEEGIEDLSFENCEINYSYFNGIDLRNSNFVDTVLYKSAFIDCRFKSDTIKLTSPLKSPSYASIDFQSLINSENIDTEILDKYYNIYDADIKNLVKTVTSKIYFKTVFISYSFKDKLFADLLNTELNKRGIKTFIWEKDAPGGHTLTEIMSTNIKKHDKILFIASANSIKSPACQYELTEGRKKQVGTWDPIFFPVHIDDFLFNVEKDQIRPISKAEEYWENIEELKKIKSIDFRKFNTPNYNVIELNKAMSSVIRELRHKSPSVSPSL